MKLEIRSFADAGELSRERLVLRALDDLDIGSYVVMRSKKADDGSPTSGSKDAYWFPDIEVKSGDLVVLYTRKGKAAKKSMSNGRTAHFYYWRKTQTFWEAEKKNTAVLLNVRNWTNQAPDS